PHVLVTKNVVLYIVKLMFQSRKTNTGISGTETPRTKRTITLFHDNSIYLIYKDDIAFASNYIRLRCWFFLSRLMNYHRPWRILMHNLKN
ncbi:hypothetical protein L9F63_005043, partial [Diploptera punctata]